MSQALNSKSMTIGESGLAAVFAVTAFLCLIGAAKALDTAFAFHASLGAAASLAAFSSSQSVFRPPIVLPPQEINGRPNYNMGPIKFAAVMSVFWGIAGFAVGLLIASHLPARAQFRPAMDELRPAAAAAYVGRDLCVRRQCPGATSFYVVQKTCRVRLAAIGAWFVVVGYNFFILVAGTGYLLGSRNQRNMPSPNGMPICG